MFLEFDRNLNTRKITNRRTSKYVYLYEDFLCGLGVISSTGSIGTNYSDTDGHPGAISLHTSTVANGGGRIGMGSGTLEQIAFGYASWVFDTCVRQPAQASTATDRYTIQHGFTDGTTNTRATDGVYFRYVDSENSNWLCVCSRNSTHTTVDTGIPLNTNAWESMRIEINANATEVKFFINNNLVGTITTNIPSLAGRTSSYNQRINKSTGTTQITTWIDYCYIAAEISVSR